MLYMKHPRRGWWPTSPFAAVFVIILGLAAAVTPAGEVHVYPAPAGEVLSKAFTVSIDDKEAPVLTAKVAPADELRRWKAMDDIAHPSDYFDNASFACFDMSGPVVITVGCPEAVRSLKILPASLGLAAKVSGADAKTFSFALSAPRNLTIEVNDDWSGSLHLFASPLETGAPSPDDPNVIYFAPGIHDIHDSVKVGDNKTVYIAGGAVLRASGWGGPVFLLQGDHITLRGRGIIDGTLCPIHSRNLILVRGRDITLEGVVLRDSSSWNVPIRQSDRVTVKDLRVLGCRANSDGIDICNSRDVTVDGCFLRTLDDLVVVKSDHGQGEVHKVVVKNCVLWNQVAHALSVGAELRDNIDDVLFSDCDVIHDKGREWTLRVYHCDSAVVRNIRFENIRIEESKKLISLWIGKAVWSKEPERGHIKDISFENIHAAGDPLRVELKGFDTAHAIDDVSFQNVTLNSNPLSFAQVKTNEFARHVTVDGKLLGD
jgi:hypothetical protein